jgi:competence protein ComEA
VQEKASPAAPATSAAQVNINTADAQTLAAGLKGVGEARAAEIVRYRETYGPFASAEELVEVKGIGKSTLDMNRDVITLE